MIRTYTRTGDRHAARRLQCDDAVRAVSIGDYSLLVLCDGCSGSAHSSEAARRITCRLADCIQYPETYLDREEATSPEDLLSYCITQGNEEAFMWLILKQIDAEVVTMRELYGCSRRELCCTLIAALVKHTGGGNTAVILTVGDGFTAVYNKETKAATLVSRGENIDGNPNLTYFCTSADAADNALVYRVERFDALLISSDGMTHAVDIDDQNELDSLMIGAERLKAATDTQFYSKMNMLLTAFVEHFDGRDLNDDCGAVYYTTLNKR